MIHEVIILTILPLRPFTAGASIFICPILSYTSCIYIELVYRPFPVIAMKISFFFDFIPEVKKEDKQQQKADNKISAPAAYIQFPYGDNDGYKDNGKGLFPCSYWVLTWCHILNFYEVINDAPYITMTKGAMITAMITGDI